MIYLDLIGESKNVHFTLNIDSPFTVIFGDSATGKTLMYNLSNKSKCKSINTNASKVIPFVSGLSVDYLQSNSILVIDADNILLEDIKDILNSNRSDIYIIYLGRKYLRNMPVSIYDLYTFKNIKGITRNIRYPFTPVLLKYFSNVIIEDDKSGYRFFSNIFTGNIRSFHGNSNIISMMKSNDLVIFDSVGFGGYIEEFLDVVHSKNIAYLGYESFEGFLLRELFHDNRDISGLNKEDCLLQMLREHNNDYSKHSGCTEDYCYKCSNSCKTTSLELFKNSSYNDVLKYYNKDNAFSSVINKMIK